MANIVLHDHTTDDESGAPLSVERTILVVDNQSGVWVRANLVVNQIWPRGKYVRPHQTT